MPAIRHLTGYASSNVRSHYRDDRYTKLKLHNPDGSVGYTVCIGFICTQGFRFLPGAELGAVEVAGYTNGDGGEGSEWRTLKVGELLYCAVLPDAGNPAFQSFILVDDNGWPIVIGAHPYPYMPPNKNFKSSIAYQHSGCNYIGRKESG